MDVTNLTSKRTGRRDPRQLVTCLNANKTFSIALTLLCHLFENATETSMSYATVRHWNYWIAKKFYYLFSNPFSKIHFVPHSIHIWVIFIRITQKRVKLKFVVCTLFLVLNGRVHLQFSIKMPRLKFVACSFSPK